MTSRFVAALCCTSALCAFSAFDGARAQQADQPAAAPAGLEEIVVTARRTEEKLQVAPVSVTALTSAKLEQQNVTSPAGLQGLVPALTITQGSGYGASLNVSIRGINQADNNLEQDSPVALYINGVYNGRMMGGLFDMVDLQSVEVERGPQGTVFGRNTTGGAINITTRAPSDDFQIQERVGYGTYDAIQQRAEIDTGEIGNTGLKALLAISHTSRDQVVKTLGVPADEGYGAFDSNAVFLDVRGDVTDDLSFNYRFDYTNEHDSALASQVTALYPGAAAYYAASPKLGGDPLVASATRLGTVGGFYQQPQNHDEFLGHSVEINYDVNDYIHLKSVSAYRSFADDSHSDQTASGKLIGPIFDVTAPGFVKTGLVSPFVTLCPGNQPELPGNNCDHQRQYQISEEFQASGTVGEFKYVGGLYFFDEHVHEDDPEFFTIVEPTSVFGPLTPLLNANPAVQAAGDNIGLNNYSTSTNYYGESKSFATYGNVAYRPDYFDDKFEFAAGLRYSFDQKTIRIRDYPLGAPPGTAAFNNDGYIGGYSVFQNGAENFHAINYSVSASYQFTPDVMGYVKTANAYKAGGFSPRAAANPLDPTAAPGYQPETNTAYEIGVKSEFYDHRLRINADFFYMQYDNIQINEFLSGTGGAGSQTVNAGAATYMGGELEFSVIPADRWLIEGSYAYVDPEFQQYGYLNPATNKLENVAAIADFNYASKETYNLGVQYDFEPFSFGQLTLRSDYSFQSPRVFHPLILQNPLNEVIKSQNFHTLGAKVILSEIDVPYGTAELKVYGDNLLNEDQRIAGIDFGAANGFANNTYALKRTIGVQLTYKFKPSTPEAAPAAYVPPPAVTAAPSVPKSYLVFFDFNKSDLTPQAVSIVNQAAANAGPAKVTQLTVTGHTDTVGSDAYNMRLSRRRAESVAAQLEKDGIASSEIEIVAKGKRDLLVPTADGVKEPQNRRVQIVYSGGPTS
jgi:iron complex outermembrane receptor protein